MLDQGTMISACIPKKETTWRLQLNHKEAVSRFQRCHIIPSKLIGQVASRIIVPRCKAVAARSITWSCTAPSNLTL